MQMRVSLHADETITKHTTLCYDNQISQTHTFIHSVPQEDLEQYSRQTLDLQLSILETQKATHITSNDAFNTHWKRQNRSVVFCQMHLSIYASRWRVWRAVSFKIK
ncbi:hypothetical protein AMECASPLE_002821 [Ameca splendens]|uniref:Uncharacterized protein n=1 Tax=Ameca splendens TaxID=208324 RepID=A0ABV0Z7Q5_9TELE